jgi:hypothetical protein
MKRIVDAGAGLALAMWLGGCSTLTGDFHQKLQIDALDAQNRPVDGMQCQVGSGSSALSVVTPAAAVRVRRSAMTLAIECRRDSLVATATVKPRRERMEEALLPFGSVGVFVDHLSGSLYAYPTALHLRVGQHVVLEHGGEAQVAKAEPIAGAQPAVAAAPQKVQVAAADPVRAAAATGAAPAPQKAHAAPKPERAAARPAKAAAAAASTQAPATPTATAAKTAAAAAAVTAARTAAPAAATNTAAARPAPVAVATAPAARLAPVNW